MSLEECSEKGRHTYRYARKVREGSRTKVRCPKCHSAISTTVLASDGKSITVDIPKHPMHGPWHTRGF